MDVRLNVKRFDPESDQGTYLQAYTVNLPNNATVLDSLIQVREYQDGTLALRCSCRSAICGSCAMRINGQARLACKTQVSSVVAEGEEVLVEPAGNMPVIKDLVVDMASFWDKVRAVKPWLQPAGPPPVREYIVSNEDMLDLVEVMACIMCGGCVSDCTVLEVDKTFLGPAALAKAWRFQNDPRDAAGATRSREWSEPGGIWDCTRCNVCVQVCPKGVKPMDQIMKLRSAAIGDGVTGNKGSHHTYAFARTVKHYGRLNEFQILPLTNGVLNLIANLAEVPGGLRMIVAGKMPVPFPKAIRGVKQVRRLFKRFERSRPIG